MSRYVVQLQQLSSIPLAVLRRPVRAAELSRVVPECCGLVWNEVRAQKNSGGSPRRDLLGRDQSARGWDRAARAVCRARRVVRSATPRGVIASITHFGDYSGPRPCARSGSRLLQAGHHSLERVRTGTSTATGSAAGKAIRLRTRMSSISWPKRRLSSGLTGLSFAIDSLTERADRSPSRS
jgi:hypothetical protein